MISISHWGMFDAPGAWVLCGQMIGERACDLNMEMAELFKWCWARHDEKMA